jgi:hypothetical protein
LLKPCWPQHDYLDTGHIQPYNSYASAGSCQEDGCDFQAVVNNRSTWIEAKTVGIIVGYKLEFIGKDGNIGKKSPPYIGSRPENSNNWTYLAQ